LSKAIKQKCSVPFYPRFIGNLKCFHLRYKHLKAIKMIATRFFHRSSQGYGKDQQMVNIRMLLRSKRIKMRMRLILQSCRINNAR
jgi:hypothetical protein